jgi:hypothetical protein
MRIRFLKFVAYKIFHLDEGEKLPWFLLWAKCLLFPISAICSKYAPVKYDIRTDTYYVRAMNYSGVFFEAFAENGMHEGQIFRFIKRENGAITIEEIKDFSKLPDKAN